MKINIRTERTGDEAFMVINLLEGAFNGVPGMALFPEEYNEE